MTDKVKIEAVERFNHHAPGDTFDADPADAEKWIGAGLAKKAKVKLMANDPDPKKDMDEPPVDKQVKAPDKKKG